MAIGVNLSEKMENVSNGIKRFINLKISNHNDNSEAHSTEMNKKLDKVQSSNKGKMLVTNGTTGEITFETIPTKLSDFNNDQGFITSNEVSGNITTEELEITYDDNGTDVIETITFLILDDS